MRELKVKDITSRLGWHSKLLIHDRQTENGTVFKGQLKDMPTKWDDRTVEWIRTGWEGIVLELG